MGRMLEALKQGSQRLSAVAAAKIPDPPLPAEEGQTEPEEELEEFPFIEVGGGPGKKLEASAAVMATPMAQAKPEKLIPKPKATAAAAPTLTQPGPMTVAFEPWPGQGGQRVAAEIISFHQPEHAVSRQYDALFERVAEGSRILLFAGAAPKAGTTTVLLNLAFSGSMRFHKRLAVVETNLVCPALAERLGLAAAPGWAEILAGTVALEKALQPTVHPLLFALTATEKVGNIPGEALHWVLGWLRERYDLVLVDGPVLEDGQSLLPLSETCDSTFLVLPQNSGAESACTPIAARLGLRLRGLIHTQFENV
jgi:Mrp family chromosome partitioning ATPase